MIPLFDTRTPLEPLDGSIKEAVLSVLEEGRFILGPEVQAFESEFAAACGSNHSVGVANGTDAIELALRAMGVGPGDEVVVPSFTFYASAEAIPPTGATPVFCDVDPDTGCITAETVEAVLTPRTKAIIAVDLFGNIAPIPLIAKLGIPILEDAAQAAGSTLCEQPAGSLGEAASFSFFPSKNLGCFGDGGSVVTSDDGIAESVRTLRFHGSRDKRSFEFIGRNSRLDEIQAAVLRVMLPSLDEWAAGRRRAAADYLAAGIDEYVKPMEAVAGVEPAWHLFVVRHERADDLAAALAGMGVEARGYYRTPVHRQPAMAQWGEGVELPATDLLARTNLAIPISPVTDRSTIEQVVAAVASAVEALG
jgi:dTDP-3-amino-3,4,6-trideoxy-alpha-D-glucose transaminase